MTSPARSTATCRPTSRNCATWTRTIPPSAPRPTTAGTCPDPRKAGDLEKLRERALLREFDDYRDSAQRRLRVFRLEAVRAGFRRAWQRQDYATIITVAQKIPDVVLQEDPKLLMWYDQAVTRSPEVRATP